MGLGLRLAAIDDREHPPVLLRDPAILDRSDDTEIGPEGCLSLPGWRGPVERHAAIKVRNHTIEGEPVELEFEGYQARVVQHEMDHLDSMLFTDRMAPDAELVPYSGPPREQQAVAEVLRDAAAPPPARAEIQASPLTEPARTRNARTPSRGAGTRAMELAGTRTPDLLGAIQALSQLSYSPEGSGRNRDPAVQGRIVAVPARLARQRRPSHAPAPALLPRPACGCSSR